MKVHLAANFLMSIFYWEVGLGPVALPFFGSASEFSPRVFFLSIGRNSFNFLKFESTTRILPFSEKNALFWKIQKYFNLKRI